MTEFDNTGTLERIDDEAVLQFLADQPDFFERYPSAVAELTGSHNSGGVVSLVERQLSALREGNRRMRAQVDDMISAARHNQALSEGVHALARALLGSVGVDEVAAATESALLQLADADHVILLLADEAEPNASADGVLRRVARDDTLWRLFSAQVDEQLFRCGLATDAQREVLFGADTAIGSTAIAPLHAGEWLGVLALGSADPSVFTRDKGHLFLQQVAELVSVALRRERLARGDRVGAR